MADLAQQLSSFLESPEGKAQLSQLAGLFAGGQTAAPAQTGQNDLSSLLSMLQPSQGNQANPSTPDLSALLSSLAASSSPTTSSQPDLSTLLSAISAGEQQQPSHPSAGSGMPDFLANLDFNMIFKIQQVFSAMNEKDKNTSLLLALKPHLSEERQKKADQAILMMKILRVLPMIAESGILGNLSKLLPLPTTSEQ